MLRRRDRGRPKGTQAFPGFAHVLARVEEAKATLLLGIPSGRSPRLSMAEALLGFEQGLSAALSDVDRWPAPELEMVRTSCREALTLALARAQRLRLEAPSDAYEDLVPVLDGLLDPLDVFNDVAETLRRAGG